MADEKDEDNIPRIQQLTENVINKIAAGEVIQRPANALKEMLENSIDAKASSVTVTAKDGGKKMLQIEDNGCGIVEDDFPILCNRFTTSKLTQFEDLQSISTFGFRGEALCSISHVATLTISSKRRVSRVGFEAEFDEGEMKKSRKVARVDGTTITAENMFRTMPTRLRTMRSGNEEYGRILDVCTRYALRNPTVAITCRKGPDVAPDVRTPGGEKRTVLDNIKTLFGPGVAREVIHITESNADANLDGGFKVEGYVTNANYSVKKGVFVLFINGRLVDCSPLKKALEAAYLPYLPKHTHPWMYIDLTIPPQNVDVNVHPTKKEVRFLHEEDISGLIAEVVTKALSGCNESRTFLSQSLLPGASAPNTLTDDTEETEPAAKPEKRKREYDYKLVRTDSSVPQGSLDAFFRGFGRQASSQAGIATEVINDDDDDDDRREKDGKRVKRGNGNEDSSDKDDDTQTMSTNSMLRTRSLVPTTDLSSVNELYEECYMRSHKGLYDIFRNYSFIGSVDPVFSLIQHRTKLYLVNVRAVTRELFYQLLLLRFSTQHRMELREPISVERLARIGLRLPCHRRGKDNEDAVEEHAKEVADLLIEKAPMLDDYFSLEITEDGKLAAMPLPLSNYVPPMHRLPGLIVRLAKEVNWTSERECFASVCAVLADFYATESESETTLSHPVQGYEVNETASKPVDDRLLKSQDTADEATQAAGRSGESTTIEAGENGEGNRGDREMSQPKDLHPTWKSCGAPTVAWQIQHEIFPALRMFLLPPRAWARDGTVVQVAALEKLYRIFERC